MSKNKDWIFLFWRFILCMGWKSHPKEVGIKYSLEESISKDITSINIIFKLTVYWWLNYVSETIIFIMDCIIKYLQNSWDSHETSHRIRKWSLEMLLHKAMRFVLRPCKPKGQSWDYKLLQKLCFWLVMSYFDQCILRISFKSKRELVF